MSYNIDTVQYIEGALKISVADRDRLLAEYEDDLPEGCFLRDHVAPDDNDMVAVSAASFWLGEGSGITYIGHRKNIISRVLPCLRGRADLLLTWEGGDKHTGLRIVDGDWTEPDVVLLLAPCRLAPDALGEQTEST